MRTKRRGKLSNACMLRAIRKLIHDPSWAPEAVVDLIEKRGGYPLTSLSILGDSAPVVIWRRAEMVEIELWEDRARVFDASGREQWLSEADMIAVCFEDEQGRGHIETVGMRRVALSFRYAVAALLTYDKEGARLWRYCADCEMLMPPMHACSREPDSQSQSEMWTCE